MKKVKKLEGVAIKAKQTEKALQESKERFRLLYERAPLGYQSLDENGHFVEINKAWLDTLGYSREEVIGKSFSDFLHPDWADHFKENFPRFKAVGEILGVEFEMLKKDSSSIMVSFHGKIGRDEKGEFKQTHCILHDITKQRISEEKLKEYSERLEEMVEERTTGLEEANKQLKKEIKERKQAEEELRASERNLREVQQMARIGHWWWDVKTGHVEWSEEVYEIFRLSPKEFTPQIDSILALSPWPADRERDKELIQKVIESHEQGSYEQRFLRPDGSTGYYDSTFQGIYDDNGTLTAMRGTVQDITERKKAEKEKKCSKSNSSKHKNWSPSAPWLEEWHMK